MIPQNDESKYRCFDDVTTITCIKIEQTFDLGFERFFERYAIWIGEHIYCIIKQIIY